MSERERMTAALVRGLTVDGMVEWIHELQDREEFLEGKLRGTETLLDGAVARMTVLEEALRELIYSMNFRSRRDRDAARQAARAVVEAGRS